MNHGPYAYAALGGEGVLSAGSDGGEACTGGMIGARL